MVSSSKRSWSPSRQFWSQRGVAVTGGTGFLGSHLVSELVALGSSVVVLVRDQVPPTPEMSAWGDKVSAVTGDLTDQATLERLLGEYEVSTVFHLGAQTQVGVANANPTPTFESNIKGTWALLDAVRHSPGVGQVVVASSDKAYGAQPVLPYSEDMALRAINPYDVSKACSDMLAACYHHTYGVGACVTRCGNLFGPGDSNYARIVPGTIRGLLRGERPLIRSDGTLTRDYLFVTDAALAYLQLAEAMAAEPTLAGQAFNFSNEQPLNVLELVHAIQSCLGTNFEPDIRATATNEIDHQFLSATKAREVLGWEPQHSLNEALTITIDWYRKAVITPR
ncbi:MAG: NAD-dependent epimerase/dehydratase family protein [Acidimicrobiales bacterium]